MTNEQERHLKFLIGDFGKVADPKYRDGEEKHGGDLWRKKGLIDMSLEEVIDQWMYLRTLKQQLDDLSCPHCGQDIILGQIDESD